MPDEREPPELSSDDFLDVPERYDEHRSIWNAATAATLDDRATERERDIIAEQLYDAYVNPDLSPDERRAARADANAAMNYWDIGFDWEAWREEMGY